MMDEEKRFGLGAGKLYVAPAGVSEENAVSPTWYAGPTKGGVTLTYTAKVHEITDISGRPVRSVRYGERIRLEGELVRLYPEVIARVIGAPPFPGKLELGGVSLAGRTARVRAVLVCRLPKSAGGGEMRFSMLAGACSGAASSSRRSIPPGTAATTSFCRAAEDRVRTAPQPTNPTAGRRADFFPYAVFLCVRAWNTP